MVRFRQQTGHWPETGFGEIPEADCWLASFPHELDAGNSLLFIPSPPV
jgi:hypothetical protein